MSEKERKRLVSTNKQNRKVPVRAESKSIDGVSMVQGVEVLAIIEIPQHCLGVLTTRGAERAIRGHGDGVQVASVADVVSLQLAVGQVPHLDVLVPAAAHDDGVLEGDSIEEI